MTPLAVALLVAVLAVAVARPRGLPEAAAAVPAAGVVLAVGLLSPAAALAEVRALAPTVGFLAAVLVLAHLADADGVFTWAGGLLARGARGPFDRTFAIAALTTAVLSLDATVVLLTPVVLDTARRLRVRPAPGAYTCAHLANSASLLLPVSNLTNLLALDATGLSFLGFTALMALPWIAVLAVEYAGLRWSFRADLTADATNERRSRFSGCNLGEEHADRTVRSTGRPPTPRVAVAVLTLTLAGFAASSALGIEPVWVAVAGATVLAARVLATRRSTPRRVVAAAAPGFCAFVLALGVAVAAVTDRGLGTAVGALLPAGESFPALLAVAVLAAVLANVVNNLPATLVLLAALGPSVSPGVVLAMLVGVGVGPNLTYVGSLATLLWRRVLLEHEITPSLRRFTVLGLVTTPAALLAGVAALWAAMRVT